MFPPQSQFFLSAGKLAAYHVARTGTLEASRSSRREPAQTPLVTFRRPTSFSSRQEQVSLSPAGAAQMPSARPAPLDRVWPPLPPAPRYGRSAPRSALAEALRSRPFSQAIAKISRAELRTPYSGRRSSLAPALRKSPPTPACAQIY